MSWWQIAYKYNWATKDQLREAVGYGLITDTEYKQITGEDYNAETA